MVTIVIVSLAAIVAMGLWTVTRSWFIIARITPELEQRFGGAVSIGSAAYEGSGVFVFRDLVLRAPGHDGAAGEVARIGRAEMLVDPARVWTGDVKLLAATLEGVLLRFSEDVHDPGRFSFMSLTPQWPDDDDDAPAAPPSVIIRDAVLEYGFHDGDDYTQLGRRLMTGSLHPQGGDEHLYTFQLGEVGPDHRRLGDGIAVRGEWNAATLEQRTWVDGLALDEATFNMCPRMLRLWWKRMQLEGRMADAVVEWDRDNRFAISFTVENVGLTLPFETDDLWARYQNGRIIDERRRPRMRVQSGTIRLENDRLILDRLVGKLGVDEDARIAAVPYNVSLVVDQIPAPVWDRPEAWMDQVLASVPFEMSFYMPAFRVSAAAEEAAALDLPKRIAQILERFQLTEWTISTNLRITRAPPQFGSGGEMTSQPVRTEGNLVIDDAVARYEKFPYRLDEVDAMLSFDNDRIKVEHLVGLASEGTPVRLTGEIRPPGRHAEVNLQLFAEHVPVDGRLREALHGSTLDLFDAVQHRPSEQTLREAGLLPDDDDLETLRTRRAALVSRLAEHHEGGGAADGEPAALRQAIERINERLAFGTFSLGGYVNLDLAIQRPAGPDQRTEIGGTMQLRNIGMLYDRFPYPFLVQRGTVRIEPDAISIVEDESQHGLTVLTPGGGRGMIRGRIHRPRIDGERRTRPDLEIVVEGDEISPLVLAAIPLTGRERDAADGPVHWPGRTRSRGARLVDGIGLRGEIDYSGRIAPSKDLQRTDFDFDITMSGGSALPTEELSELIGAAGLIWPDGFRLEDVSGHLRVARDGVMLSRFEGKHPTGRVHATGELDLDAIPVTTALNVEFTDLELGPYLLALVPGDNAPQVRELWDRYQPSGRFDARLEYRETGGAADPPRIRVDHARVEVVVGGTPIAARIDGGHLGVAHDAVTFDDLALRFARRHEGVEFEDGGVRLSGSYGFAADETSLEVTGKWENGRFDSPIVIEVMNLLGATRASAHYAELSPSGLFDADFHYRLTPRAPSYRLDLRPRIVSFRKGGRRLDADVDAGGVVTISPRGAELSSLTGRLEDGRFRLDGHVHFDPLSEVDLWFDYEGPVASAGVRVVLPPGVAEVLDQLELHDGRRTALRSCRLRLARPGEDLENETWSVHFDGDIEVEGAALTAGARAEEITGRAHLNVRREADQPLSVTMDATLDEMRFYGRRVTDVRIPLISYDDATRAIRMPEFRGDCYGGLVSARAEVVGEEKREYDISIELVALSLAELYADVPAEDDAASARTDAPRNRGRLYGDFRVGGEIGRPRTRRGRGALRAIGGSLENVPLVLQLVNLLQFTFPLRGDLDHADVEYFVDGDWMVFERILFESTLGEIATLQLFGEGRMHIDTLELNTRFRSRSAMLLIREIAGRVSDELYVIEVTGPLGQPKARLLPLPGLRESSHNDRLPATRPVTPGEESTAR